MEDIRILVADDDPNIRDLIRLYLEKEGFKVSVAENGDRALEMLSRNPPDLIILDIMMPGTDGWEVCRQVRRSGSLPVIMLSARGETFDKVLGLELGADDYIVKPFEARELAARVRAVLRRSQGRSAPEEELVFPGLVISRSSYTVSYRGKKLELPPKELELLYFLARNKNQVFTRDQLLEKVWDYGYSGDSRTVDVHIRRLREKLPEGDPVWSIRTVWGVGYKFEVKG